MSFFGLILGKHFYQIFMQIANKEYIYYSSPQINFTVTLLEPFATCASLQLQLNSSEIQSIFLVVFHVSGWAIQQKILVCENQSLFLQLKKYYIQSETSNYQTKRKSRN